MITDCLSSQAGDNFHGTALRRALTTFTSEAGMGLFDFFRRTQPASQEVGSSPAQRPLASAETYLPVATVVHSANGKQTTIDSPDFLLELPFRWEQVANEASLELRNAQVPEQLIVTARTTVEPLTPADRRLLVAKFAEIHRNALQRTATGAVQISNFDEAHNGPESEGRFYAKANGMTMAFGVRYRPGRVFTFSIYRYTEQPLGMPFGVYAATILDLLKLKPPQER
jgi:hypothetical protein